MLAATTPPAEIGTLVDQGQRARRRSERRAGDQPRRTAGSRSSPSAACSRSICSSPTRRPARSCTSSRARRPIRISRAFSSSTRPARGTPTASASRSRRSPTARPALAIFDARAATSEREIPLADVDEIFNPTWAPDGHAICFTGMSRGLTDLFVYDLDRGAAAAADQRRRSPICSRRGRPTARRIAFATDRFSTQPRHARHRRLPPRR